MACAACGAAVDVGRDAGGEAPPKGTPDVDRPRGQWLLRRPNGSVQTFKELTTLQKWIVERKVCRDDEISKSGETWKRLGTIAELASFFQAVESQAQAVAPGVTLPSAVSPSVPPPLGSLPPLPGVGTSVPLARQGSSGRMPVVGPMEGSEAGPLSLPPVPPSLVADADGVEALDEDDPVLTWQRAQRRRNRLWVGGAALVVVGLVGWGVAGPVAGSSWTRVKDVLGLAPAPEALAALQSSREAWLRSGPEDLAEAVRQADRALAASPGWADALAAKSLALTMSAVGMLEDQRMLVGQVEAWGRAAVQPVAGSPDAAGAAALREQATRAEADATERFKSALGLARQALEARSEDHLPNLAAAAYFVARRVPEEAQLPLERARRLAPPGDLATALVEAEYQALHPGMRAQGAQSLARLVAENPVVPVARYRWAVWLAADGQVAEAARQAEAVLKDVPTHVRCRALLDAHAAPAHVLPTVAPASASGGAAPAGTSRSAEAASRPATSQGGGAREPPEPRGDPAGGGEEDGEAKPSDKRGGQGGFAKVLRDADRHRDKGRCSRAQPLYLKAAALEPDRAEPHVGLAWCALDAERYGAALSAFERALALDGTYAEAHLGLGQAYEFKGDKGNALKHYQRYLAMLPNGPEAEVARNAVSKLKVK
jgi:tetratricopeptide (TPR) repeat protein